MPNDQAIHNSRIVQQAIRCVTLLGLVFAGIGGFLLWKGYQSGELFVGGATTGLGGLLGIISNPRQQQQPDVTLTTDPPKVTLKQADSTQPPQPPV